MTAPVTIVLLLLGVASTCMSLSSTTTATNASSTTADADDDSKVTSERHRRLIPYMTFYYSRQQFGQQPNFQQLGGATSYASNSLLSNAATPFKVKAIPYHTKLVTPIGNNLYSTKIVTPNGNNLYLTNGIDPSNNYRYPTNSITQSGNLQYPKNNVAPTGNLFTPNNVASLGKFLAITNSVNPSNNVQYYPTNSIASTSKTLYQSNPTNGIALPSNFQYPTNSIASLTNSLPAPNVNIPSGNIRYPSNSLHSTVRYVPRNFPASSYASNSLLLTSSLPYSSRYSFPSSNRVTLADSLRNINTRLPFIAVNPVQVYPTNRVQANAYQPQSNVYPAIQTPTRDSTATSIHASDYQANLNQAENYPTNQAEVYSTNHNQVPNNQATGTQNLIENNPANQVQVSDYPTNRGQASGYPTNHVQSSDYPVNSVIVSDYPANRVQASNYPTNQVQATDYPINQVKESDYPTNQVQASDYPSNQVSGYPINQVQASDYPTNQIQTTDFPANHRPIQASDYPSNLIKAPHYPVTKSEEPYYPLTNKEQFPDDLIPSKTPLGDTLSQILALLRQAGKLPLDLPATTSAPAKPVDHDDDYTYYDEEEEDEDIPVVKAITKLSPAKAGASQLFYPGSKGGTPGRPGVDYPILSKIPTTSFDCKNQRYKGFFGDPDTNCQVWHYCDLNGGQASFLCPNGTIFSQVGLTCDWWFNVRCDSTVQLYVLNERLYKYILPATPSFPEDYSGPVVDRYLTLKFQEKEEKRKQKELEKEKELELEQEKEQTKEQEIET